MSARGNQIAIRTARGLLLRLARDRAGNTMALVAAAMVPLLAMIGGGVDMGRSYLSQSRLQQACDAGVLAARKKLGSEVVTTGVIPADVADSGNRFFDFNFRDGAYGTAERTFEMTLEPDYAISGVATAIVPTSVMRVFGFTEVPLQVTCEARLNFSNTDVMMVLDTTGSMRQTNPGDSAPKIDALRDVVKSFHAQLEGSKGPATRIRYGFVPYSTNVNVGHLLRDEWVTSAWTYQSREASGGVTSETTSVWYRNWVYKSGLVTSMTVSSYAATYHPAGTENGNPYYDCPTSPSSTGTADYQLLSTTTEPFAGPPAGTRKIEKYRVTYNGTWYSADLSGTTCTVRRNDYTLYVEEFEKITDPANSVTELWDYKPITRDVSNWRNEIVGCIEERSTYEIDDYANVDFTRALDLDLDRVPVNGEPDTQWRPMYPDAIYDRALYWDGTGSFSPAPVLATASDFMPPNSLGFAACPSAARALAEMSASEVSSYVDALAPRGSTYHDIGMIWGGRLLSPSGLFAAENADVDGKATSRHLIFLTDGQTAPLDLSYGSYGVEPLDQRRWSEASAFNLTETVENRFTVACTEVKKRNITVWVVSFGTSLNPMLSDCAGPGHAFEASDSAQLNDAFSKIAKAMGDLRISK